MIPSPAAGGPFPETTTMKKQQSILILDFGSQVTQLIARRIREAHVYCEIHPYTMSLKEIENFNPAGIVLSGGPASVLAKGAPKISERILNLEVPVLGICYGMQLMSQLLGGKVKPATHREYGNAELEVVKKDRLFAKVPKRSKVWMSHGDHVSRLPKGFEVLGRSQSIPYAAMGDSAKRRYGIQYHPEVFHTQYGMQMLSNFVHSICGCHATWTMASFLKEKTEEIRRQVGKRRVLLGLSGGVDSSVTAVLLQKAIGNQLTCCFVDNGLLRKDEQRKVEKLYSSN